MTKEDLKSLISFLNSLDDEDWKSIKETDWINDSFFIKKYWRKRRIYFIF